MNLSKRFAIKSAGAIALSRLFSLKLYTSPFRFRGPSAKLARWGQERPGPTNASKVL